MIDFIKTWANQIIVAIIIATIFEMILPNGNNKKYIKMIIGIYVLFTLIQPIASKLTGKEIMVSNGYKKYFNEDILDVSSKDFENNNSKLIEQAYINNIKSDIQAKVEQKGYIVYSCDLDIANSKENYGLIEKIILKIQKQDENESIGNAIEIEKVEINKNEEAKKEKLNVTNKEKQELIQYLSEEYSIDKDRIVIN